MSRAGSGRGGLGDAGARLSGAQGPGRGVPSRRPRPRSRAASCGVGGGSQAAGRRGQRAGPGAGSCGAGSPLGESRTSALAPRARKPRSAAAAAAERPAPGGRAAGRGRARGAGPGSAAAMARRGGGGRPGSPAAEGAAGAASPARAGGDRGEAEAAARQAAPPGPRTAGCLSLSEPGIGGVRGNGVPAGGRGGQTSSWGWSATASAAGRPITGRSWGARAASPSRVSDREGGSPLPGPPPLVSLLRVAQGRAEDQREASANENPKEGREGGGAQTQCNSDPSPRPVPP